MDLGRIATAMVTPFQENGDIDFEAVERLIEYLLANGTDSIVVCGTTGESPTLSTEEKLQLIRFTVEKVNKRVPVIAGTGSNNTKQTIELTKKIESLGVDGVMLVAPYYNKPNQKGLYAHFEAVAEETTLPIVVYNVPGRTSSNIEAATTIALSKIPNIQVVKEASGNLDQISEILANTHDKFLVYSGDDALTLPLLAIGGRGVISVASHIVGNEMQAMIQAFEEGRHAFAAKMHQTLLPLFKQLFKNPNPVPIKYAMSKVGFHIEKVRLPLVEMTDEEKQEFDHVWEQVKQNI
ncbi:MULTISPECIES: 4-hydroxy-tetrahydrodipicolinate synthase [Ureibacillus]|uniref:4-hydroxy-tetrahydrodipicolinate synthase n=1 Tax=Ureibacillus thermosphaericus TaxID=51173 RepID=A0A840PUH1_URETH|nr:4-hydroxy-tetrahydrodipicolinate synthase [Ureibacillus thermosphaericus]MBB5147818.1 4-hydroxy-tetrahydrodipicolinate synthase [Ureibacillus thermosphaericus]NKZ30380.1 4-hydroxy-tetrahydrodipicolinate synthase [Ureibacillus thermosphaericus]